MESDSRVAIVSGGSRGLGAALVRDLLEHGYRVATFSRSQTEVVTDTVARYGAERFVWESLDGRDHAGVSKFVMRIAKELGRIDALVNNAAIAVEGVLALTSPKDIEAAIALNVTSTIHLTNACTKAMLRQHRGSIVNISSVNAIRGHQGVAVYSATKAALDGFSRSLARELGKRNIRVNSLAPGYLATDMTKDMPADRRAQIIRRTPAGRLGEVQDIAPVVRFLLSDDAAFITGQTIVVDGGLTC